MASIQQLNTAVQREALSLYYLWAEVNTIMVSREEMV